MFFLYFSYFHFFQKLLYIFYINRIYIIHFIFQFQNEVRKILITLVKASARIILYSPEAQKFCDILKEKLEARCKPNINPNAIKTLTEMGYSEKKVLKILRLRKYNLSFKLIFI